VCRYEVDPGPCRAAFPKFYYDEARDSCEPFAYGGCHGGPNRFSTLHECEDICKYEKGKHR
jgi:papilin